MGPRFGALSGGVEADPAKFLAAMGGTGTGSGRDSWGRQRSDQRTGWANLGRSDRASTVWSTRPGPWSTTRPGVPQPWKVTFVTEQIDQLIDDATTAALQVEVAAARERVDDLQRHYEELLADPSVIQEDRDAAALLLGTARSALETAEDAARRADDGTYGRCEVCGVVIPRERLDAVPDAARCVACSS